VVQINLSEWETRRPEPGNDLEGLALNSGSARTLAADLGKAGLLEVAELRSGLMLRSFSYVGKVRLGEIEIGSSVFRCEPWHFRAFPLLRLG
jgi:5-methylcytosine-specific restriction enzyme subunit McrC